MTRLIIAAASASQWKGFLNFNILLFRTVENLVRSVQLEFSKWCRMVNFDSKISSLSGFFCDHSLIGYDYCSLFSSSVIIAAVVL